MNDVADELPPGAAFPALSLPSVGTATVTEVEGDHVALRSQELGRARARVAVPGWHPSAGDRVLVLDDGRGRAFVVGVLAAQRVEPFVPLRVEESESGTRIVVERGDLELTAREGAVIVRAGRDVALESERDVTIDARGRAVMKSSDADGARSAVTLDGETARIEAGALEARAARLALLVEELAAFGAKLDARIEDVRIRSRRIDTEVRDLVERADTVLRRASGLAQIEAGRLRLVAEGALHAWAERVKLKAKGVFAVDGESIHLG